LNKPTSILIELSAEANAVDEHLGRLRSKLTLNAGIQSIRAMVPEEIFYWAFCFLNRAFI
jgi:hypothetical protein